MDIQQTIAPAVAPAAVKAQSADKAESPQEGQVAAPAFSQLLRGLKRDAADASAMQDLSGAVAVAGGEGFSLDAMNLVGGALSIEGLLGQTQRLDAADADLAMQDGSFLLAQQEAGLAPSLVASQGWGAQPHIATGQSVATVAAGVQAALPSGANPEPQIAMAAASAVLLQASDSAESVTQAVVDGVVADTAGEGRVALQGAWTLEDPQLPLNPALQRVIGQVEQWAAASAGVQPKPSERAEGGKSVSATADLLAAGQGSGTRLTDNAVTQAQQAQNAALESHHEAPVQDMRFWLQGKQQRAEVVLEKDGQAVRVQVSVRGNEAHVTFKADQAQTRELLDASLSQLREMLQQQGVELAGVSVQADARGDQPSSGQGQRSPWEATPVQHGQVVVPVADAAVKRAGPSQGLDLYA